MLVSTRSKVASSGAVSETASSFVLTAVSMQISGIGLQIHIIDDAQAWLLAFHTTVELLAYWLLLLYIAIGACA